ncbi:MAG: YdcF family protein [Butyrivibrio sp.]|nr:YdcF family protein [Butyrivibrio sp.]
MSLFKPKIRILWLVLTVICFMYSAMVYMVGSGTLSFTIWLAGSAFFALCWFLAGKGRWKRVPKSLRCGTVAVLTAIVAVFLVCFIAIFSHFFDEGEAGLDYIIVLGAQMRASGPSVVYRYRLEKAGSYLTENEDTVCITTGAQGFNESISEGAGGREYLIAKGIQADRIIAEEQSLDTDDNISNALAMIKEREGSTDGLRIGIVTNGFHVFRGVHIAQKLTTAEVYGIAAYMEPQYVPNNVVRECFGILRDMKNGLLEL